MFKGIQFFIPILIAIVVVVLGALLYNGVIHINNPTLHEYPVRGVDVSAYQGIIDWNVLSDQNIQFAYIKATEGSGMQDKNFKANWAGANKTTLKAGAYHFFSFESPGTTQADNYIKTVPKTDGSLPPAIDLELYGTYSAHPPVRENVTRELTVLFSKLEAAYGKKPVIYITEECYTLYIKGGYANNPLWVRNVFSTPILPNGRKWTFWQYSDRFVLKGYNGKERFIDMNAYNGTPEQFNSLCTEPMDR